MPDEQQPDSPADAGEALTGDERSTGDSDPKQDLNKDAAVPDEKTDTEPSSGRVLSIYGLVSAALGLVSIAAVVAGLLTWSMHHSDVAERSHQSQALQAAASWTSVLINLNADNVEKGMERLRDKTVGELNAEFDATTQPYREVLQRIQSRSTGRVEAVAIETQHHDLDGQSGTGSTDPAERQSSDAGRTDPVLVVATSVAENVGGKAQTVHWALQLDVSDVDGRLLISRLKSIR